MKHIDERIIKTKTFLKKALLTLLETEKISKIKITTLCNKAEINRATFYSHYKDISELFDEIIKDFLEQICSFIIKINEQNIKEDRMNSCLSFIQYVDKNSELFLLIFENSHNEENFSEQYKKLKNKINKKISIKYDKNVFSSYITDYYFYAGGAILHTWIKNGKKEAHNEIAFLMLNLLNKGASFYIMT